MSPKVGEALPTMRIHGNFTIEMSARKAFESPYFYFVSVGGLLHGTTPDEIKARFSKGGVRALDVEMIKTEDGKYYCLGRHISAVIDAACLSYSFIRSLSWICVHQRNCRVYGRDRKV